VRFKTHAKKKLPHVMKQATSFKCILERWRVVWC